MKKSAKVTLTVVAAMGLASCGRSRPDPCDQAYFNEMACQDAVRSGGYYYGGSWYPMMYHYPYPYYYDHYRTYVGGGGRVSRGAGGNIRASFRRRRDVITRRGTWRIRLYRCGTRFGIGGIMRRVTATPRSGWQAKVEEAGLTWHTGEQTYWNEAAFYEFTAKEVDVLEAATNELETMTLQAAQHVIDHKLYARLEIPEIAIPLIESSWEAEPPSLYGRFDFAYDGTNPPKLLEYNADTPTSLVEAAVVQWYWLQDCFPKRDQFNSLHERLVALWKDLGKYLPGRRIDFCSMDDAEDGMTVTYLQDTAQQAGLEASIFPIDEVGWDGSQFVGPDDR